MIKDIRFCLFSIKLRANQICNSVTQRARVAKRLWASSVWVLTLNQLPNPKWCFEVLKP